MSELRFHQPGFVEADKSAPIQVNTVDDLFANNDVARFTQIEGFSHFAYTRHDLFGVPQYTLIALYDHKDYECWVVGYLSELITDLQIAPAKYTEAAK